MSKWEALSYLENSEGYISGEFISTKLNISRAAVWKHIKALRAEGYNIESVSNNGYCLVSSPNSITEYEIKKAKKQKGFGEEIVYLETIASTNSAAKKLAEEGAKNGTVVIAESQTGGRGRFGRSFYSPKGEGAFFSVIFRPKIDLSEASVITCFTAVAVCNGIENACGFRPKVKWTNDILLNSKKICGILTELSLTAETNLVDYIIIGIGLNINNKDFPEEIKDIATSLFIETKKEQKRASIVAHILDELDCILNNEWNKKERIEQYRKDMAILGKEIFIITPNEKINATALDIAEDGSLIVRLKDETIKNINSGEITIKLEMRNEE
jgi:BirA family biotin operon repressor/biotin-[acetyl-CoA-carboxylase] ligase